MIIIGKTEKSGNEMQDAANAIETLLWKGYLQYKKQKGFQHNEYQVQITQVHKKSGCVPVWLPLNPKFYTNIEPQK